MKIKELKVGEFVRQKKGVKIGYYSSKNSRGSNVDLFEPMIITGIKDNIIILL